MTDFRKKGVQVVSDRETSGAATPPDEPPAEEELGDLATPSSALTTRPPFLRKSVIVATDVLFAPFGLKGLSDHNQIVAAGGPH